MIDATVNLTGIHCNAESDWFGAEPYLWTVFFYTDLSTIPGSDGVVVTHTPHQTSTTRGMYPNGIEAGDDFDIPISMGEYNITLDNGGLGLSLIGCLFVLIDERNTDADAIKAGHVALGISAQEALNDLIASKLFSDDKSLTPEEVKAMTTYIKSAVLGAIEDKLDWWDYLDQQDRFVGSGFKVYSDAQINEIAADGGVDQFVVNIRSERIIPNSNPIFGQQPQPPSTTTLIDDYGLSGTLRVRQADRVPDPTDPKKDQFDKAVQTFQAVQAKIVCLTEGISKEKGKGKGKARQELLAQLRHTRKITLKKALRALRRTRNAYDPPDKITPVNHLCIEPDCCFEHARQVYLNCRAEGFGKTYCLELESYRYALCKKPNALPLLALPLAPPRKD